jgi:hypothetical protein
VRYPKFFSKPKPFRSDLTPESFRSLRSREIGAYFSELPSSFETSEGVTGALALDHEEVALFDADFGRLLSHRKDLQGLSHARQFVKWWDEHKAVYLTRPVIRGYRETGLTLGELLDDLHLHYIAGQNAMREGSRTVKTVRRFFNHKLVVGLAFSLGVLLSNSAGFLWSLALLGPGVQMINSYTQAVVTPMAQTAQQKGSRDLGPLAVQIQDWITNRSKADEARSKIEVTTQQLQKTDFSKLPPAEAQAKWAQYEKTYFNLFLNLNKTLPSHLRDGRGMLKEWLMFMQLGVANNLSTFDNQYWTHSRELASLQTAIKQSGGPSAKQRELMRLHRDTMSAAESRIAGALAAWKLYEFMYPEYSKDPQNATEQGQMRTIYASFSKSMRFDLYVKQFAAQMQQVLHQMDADFLTRDMLAEHRAP